MLLFGGSGNGNGAGWEVPRETRSANFVAVRINAEELLQDPGLFYVVIEPRSPLVIKPPIPLPWPLTGVHGGEGARGMGDGPRIQGHVGIRILLAPSTERLTPNGRVAQIAGIAPGDGVRGWSRSRDGAAAGKIPMAQDRLRQPCGARLVGAIHLADDVGQPQNMAHPWRQVGLFAGITPGDGLGGWGR